MEWVYEYMHWSTRKSRFFIYEYYFLSAYFQGTLCVNLTLTMCLTLQEIATRKAQSLQLATAAMDSLSFVKAEVEKKRKALEATTAILGDEGPKPKKYVSRRELERIREQQYREEQGLLENERQVRLCSPTHRLCNMTPSDPNHQFLADRRNKSKRVAWYAITESFSSCMV